MKRNARVVPNLRKFYNAYQDDGADGADDWEEDESNAGDDAGDDDEDDEDDEDDDAEDDEDMAADDHDGYAKPVAGQNAASCSLLSESPSTRRTRLRDPQA